jgi:hypothetical protein
MVLPACRTWQWHDASRRKGGVQYLKIYIYYAFLFPLTTVRSLFEVWLEVLQNIVKAFWQSWCTLLLDCIWWRCLAADIMFVLDGVQPECTIFFPPKCLTELNPRTLSYLQGISCLCVELVICTWCSFYIIRYLCYKKLIMILNS